VRTYIHKKNYLFVIRAKIQFNKKVWQQRVITIDKTLPEAMGMEYRMQNLTFVALRNQFLKRHVCSPCAHSRRSSTPAAAGSCRHRRDARLRGTVPGQKVLSVGSPAGGKASGTLRSIPLSQLSHLDVALRWEHEKHVRKMGCDMECRP